MPQLPKRFRLDLTDAFPGNGENLTNFLERVLAAIVEAKAQADDAFFARCQRPQDSRNLVP